MVSEKHMFILAHAEARRRAMRAVADAPEGFRVTVEPPRRNLDINAALHAKLGEIAARVEWAGKLRDIECWKRLLVAAWSRAQGEHVEMLPALDGHGVEIVFRRTSQLSQADMRDLMGYVDAWCAERSEFQRESAA